MADTREQKEARGVAEAQAVVVAVFQTEYSARIYVDGVHHVMPDAELNIIKIVGGWAVEEEKSEKK